MSKRGQLACQNVVRFIVPKRLGDKLATSKATKHSICSADHVPSTKATRVFCAVLNTMPSWATYPLANIFVGPSRMVEELFSPNWDPFLRHEESPEDIDDQDFNSPVRSVEDGDAQEHLLGAARRSKAALGSDSKDQPADSAL